MVAPAEGIARGAGESLSLRSRSWSRTVSAMIGMLSALFRVSVTILAVQLRSGRISCGGVSSVTSTSKSTARSLEPDAVCVGVSFALWLTWVTWPRKAGVRGTRRSSPRPNRRGCSRTTSVSSTCTLARITERSAIVMSSPRLLEKVPGTATSPSSTARRTTRPEIGEIEPGLGQVVPCLLQARPGTDRAALASRHNSLVPPRRLSEPARPTPG